MDSCISLYCLKRRYWEGGKEETNHEGLNGQIEKIRRERERDGSTDRYSVMALQSGKERKEEEDAVFVG